MGASDVLELTLRADESIDALEAALRTSPSRRVVIRVSNCDDGVSVIERLRDHLTTNISRTVIVYVE